MLLRSIASIKEPNVKYFTEISCNKVSREINFDTENLVEWETL